MNVTIPIVLLSSETMWSFVLKRRQFPIHVRYAMTINTSQGLSLKFIGVYLSKSVFTHGQLNCSIMGDFTRGFQLSSLSLNITMNTMKD